MARNTPLDLPDDFDELLRRALAAEPSPEFLPRVRERISAEPQRSPWGWPLLFSAASLSIACVCVISLNLLTRPVAAPPVASAPAVRIAPHIAPGVRQDPEALDVPARAPFPVTAGVRDAAVKPAQEQPVVLVDERQRLAFRTLARMLGDGKLTDKAFAQTTPQSLDAIREQIVPVGVAPVTVSPIAVDGVLQK